MPAYPASLSPIPADFPNEWAPCADLAELLIRSANRNPAAGFWMMTSEREGEFLSYPELLHEAASIVGGLRAGNLPLGSNVVLLFERPRDIIPAFWACILGGYIPCTI